MAGCTCDPVLGAGLFRPASFLVNVHWLPSRRYRPGRRDRTRKSSLPVTFVGMTSIRQLPAPPRRPFRTCLFAETPRVDPCTVRILDDQRRSPASNCTELIDA